MLELLPDHVDRMMVSPYDLISLKDAGIRGGAFAMRPLDEQHLESLAISDPKAWPAITVTLSTRGYIVIDGYHRWEITKREGFDTIRATCEPFSDENAVIEAAFRANLRHGLKASAETRSDYAFWLHTTYPQMEQVEIAARVGVTQSTVSKAIARNEEHLRRARQETGEEEEVDEQTHKKLLKKSCRSFTRRVLRFLKEVEAFDDEELALMLQETIKKKEEKAKLVRIARLLSGNPPMSQMTGPLRLHQFATSPNQEMLQKWAQEP